MERIPNQKIWECPIFGKICNTRGVPAYVRNKLGLPWVTDYWHNPDKLKEDYQLKIFNQKLLKIKKVIIDNQIKEEQCSGILEKSMTDFLWAINFSYKNNGHQGLSDLLRYIKDYTDRERKIYFNRLRTNVSHGTGTDLFS